MSLRYILHHLNVNTLIRYRNNRLVVSHRFLEVPSWISVRIAAAVFPKRETPFRQCQTRYDSSSVISASRHFDMRPHSFSSTSPSSWWNPRRDAASRHCRSCPCCRYSRSFRASRSSSGFSVIQKMSKEHSEMSRIEGKTRRYRITRDEKEKDLFYAKI